ncbi:MAG: DUF4058 family protein [Planctomycetota bacterium]
MIAIPLRPRDADVPLDLQSAVDRCYRAGRYWQVSRDRLQRPLVCQAEQAWMTERLQEAGLK